MRPVVPVTPGPGQESVWDYPRPPRVEPAAERVRVVVDGEPLADTTRARRVLETAGAPVYCIPAADVRLDRLVRSAHRSVCEWKGAATYWDLADRGPGTYVGWSYEDPTPRFLAIAGFLTFYPERLGTVTVGGEEVRGQPGEFYGGWVTDKVVGPFKGGPGSMWW